MAYSYLLLDGTPCRIRHENGVDLRAEIYRPGEGMVPIRASELREAIPVEKARFDHTIVCIVADHRKESGAD